jgi:hypothetical protein
VNGQLFSKALFSEWMPQVASTGKKNTEKSSRPDIVCQQEQAQKDKPATHNWPTGHLECSSPGNDSTPQTQNDKTYSAGEKPPADKGDH